MSFSKPVFHYANLFSPGEQTIQQHDWRKGLSRKIKNVLIQLEANTAIVANQLVFVVTFQEHIRHWRTGRLIYLSSLSGAFLRKKPEHPEKTQDFDRAMTDCLHTSRQRDEDRDHDVNGERRYSSKTRHVCWNVWAKYFSNIWCFVGKVKSLKTWLSCSKLK